MSTQNVACANHLLGTPNRAFKTRRTVWALTALFAATIPLGCTAAWPSTPTAATELVRFDATQGKLSEGLAVRGSTAYFGFASSSEVVAVDIESGAVSPYSSLPTPVAGKGFMTGLAFRGNDLYGALVSFVPEVQAGIYRISGAGAPASLFAKHAEMAFPNGLAFGDAGQLYVTDASAGAVFRISPAGEISKWMTSPLLAGNKDACGQGNGVGVPFDIGANGIVLKGDSLYVTNTDRGSIVRIPVLADGSAGAPTLFVEPSCAALSGIDGLAVAPDGSLVAAVNHLNKLVSIDGVGNITTLLESAPLDFPTSLVFAGGALYIDNFAFLDAKNPGLLRVR